MTTTSRAPRSGSTNAKKVARKAGFRPFPIATALLAELTRAGRLRLVRTTARGARFTELVLEAASVTVREGDVGTPGRASRQLKVRRPVGQTWILTQAKTLLAKGYVAEQVAIEPGVIARWLEEVARIGKTRGWQIESERIFTV